MSMNFENILYDLYNQESVGSHYYEPSHVNDPGVYRLEKQSQRWYYKLDPTRFYTSATTWLQKVMPTPYYLLDWYRRHSKEYLDEKMFMSSNYGTACHVVMALMLRGDMMGKSFDLSRMNEFVDVYWDLYDITEPNHLDELVTKQEWTERLQNDMVCIMSFIQDYEFSPYAIEYVGAYEGDESCPAFGGAIDLVGTMKYKSKKVSGIIDLKTGSLSNEQVYQLMCYRLIWEQHNPHIGIDYHFNLKPKRSTSKVRYELKCRNTSDYEKNFNDYCRIARRTLSINPKPIAQYGKIRHDTNLSKIMVNPYTYVEEKHQ